jgi:hypothetical protein
VELTALAEEIRALRPAIAKGPSTVVRVLSTPAPAIEAACWSDTKAHYVVALNRSKLAVKGELKLSGVNAALAQRFETGAKADAGTDVIRDAWAPNETHIYRIAR